MPVRAAFNKARHDPSQEYFWPGAAPSRAQVKAAKKVELDPNDEELQLNLQRYLNAGMDLAGWYNNTYPTLLKFFGHDEHKTSLFIDLLASTSPRYNITMNIKKAMLYQRALEGGWLGRLYDDFDAHLNNCCRALIGMPLSGPKVTAFQSNLNGHETNVTVDTWIMRAFGLRELDDEDAAGPSMAEYRAVSTATRRFAESCGMAPREVQAALWVGIKRIVGEPEDTALPFEVIFAQAVDELSRQLTFDGFERAADNQQVDAVMQEFHGARRGAGGRRAPADDEEIAFNPGSTYKTITLDALGREHVAPSANVVSARLAAIARQDTTIVEDVIASIFNLPEEHAQSQMRAFYCLRQNTLAYLKSEQPFTPDLLNNKLCSVPIKQYTSPEIVA